MYYIIARNSIKGFHRWDNAPEHLKFLRHEHRHVFEITCVIPVTHDDRDLEIIETEIEIENYLMARYGDSHRHLQLGTMSCEMLAKELCEKFDCKSVTVREDGYGGACYVNAGE
jgi:hypothetical protein